MPRPSPHPLAFHVYRAAARDAVRQSLASEDLQFEAFRRLVRRARRTGPLDIYAWCLLPSHWHLVLPPASVRALSAYLRSTAERRFVSVPILDERQFAATLLYVEAVPLRARLVDRAERWRWSSLRERLSPPRGGEPLAVDGPWTLPPNWPDIVNELGRDDR